jgi:hypothetical protein
MPSWTSYSTPTEGVDMARTTQPITIRPAAADDDSALRRLAALDSRRPPEGPFAVAEVGGELVAALSRSDGAVIADPFRPTAHVVVLLEVHAAQLAAAPERDTPGRSALRAGRAVLRGLAAKRPTPVPAPVRRRHEPGLSLAAHALLRAP